MSFVCTFYMEKKLTRKTSKSICGIYAIRRFISILILKMRTSLLWSCKATKRILTIWLVDSFLPPLSFILQFFNCLCRLFENISFSAFSQASRSTLKRLRSRYATQREIERVSLSSLAVLKNMKNRKAAHKNRKINKKNVKGLTTETKIQFMV